MQAYCGQCQKFNVIVKDSKFCLYCGRTYKETGGTDIRLLALSQKKAIQLKVTMGNQWMFCEGAVMIFLLLAGIVMGMNFFYIGVVLFLFLIILVVVPIYFIDPLIEKQFPDIYDNPNWKP
ncbi:MAG: hypothetical protein HZA35_02305 [Parcubacteria group bacterium]|nr:hypothetical protein [Parcubacteria group bacterium]